MSDETLDPLDPSEVSGEPPNPPEPVAPVVVPGMTAQQLVSIVAATVAETLKGLNLGFDSQSLGDTIGKSVAQGMSAIQRKKVSFGEYISRPHSVFHPDPNPPHLTRPVSQNGVNCAEPTLTDEEIVLLNLIDRSGRYCDRFVEVAFNIDGASESVDIRYPNATADHRFALREVISFNKKRHKTVFQAMLESIVEDQAEEREQEDREEESRQSRRARPGVTGPRPLQGHMGGSKAYQEARARAEAKEREKAGVTV